MKRARFSRRIRGLLPEPIEPCRRVPYLPTEVKKLILEYLEKMDLKRVRLASKDMSALAGPLLFERLYISPKEYDLQVFLNVATHPILSKWVKSVIWDVSRFGPCYSRREYFNRLCESTVCFRAGRRIEHPTTRFHMFFNLVRWQVHGKNKFYETFQHDAFVEEGYQAWQRIAEYEVSCLTTQHFFETVCRGLKTLDRLQSVTVAPSLWTDFWYDVDPHAQGALTRRQIGTPVMRSWSHYFAYPTNLLGRDIDSAAVNFQVIVNALSIAATNIKKFNFYQSDLRCFGRCFEGGLSIREVKDFTELDTLFRAAYLVFRKLTVFNMRFYINFRDLFHQAISSEMFPRLLSQMDNLMEMHVNIANGLYEDGYIRHRACDYRHVFPKYGVWPHVTKFTLIGAALGGFDLLTLVTIQMPKLCHLELDNIELTNWLWEGVFEGLHLPGMLQALHLPREHYRLLHGGHESYPDAPLDLYFDTPGAKHRERASLFFKDLEDYVVHGGRHPSLPATADNQDSLRYVEGWNSDARRRDMYEKNAPPKNLENIGASAH